MPENKMKDPDITKFSLLKNEIKDIIYDTINEIKLLEAMIIYESECVLTVTGERNITDIFTDIRAIEGVTIVSTMEGGATSVSLGIKAEKTRIRIKFVKGKYSLRHRASTLVHKIGRVSGVIGIKVLKTRAVEAT